MFFEQIPQKLDLSLLVDKECESLDLHIYNVDAQYNSKTNILKRVIGFREIVSALEKKQKLSLLPIGGFCFDNTEIPLNISEVVSDLKAGYLILDVKFMKDRGYKEVYFKDLTPGDTTISYQLEGRNG